MQLSQRFLGNQFNAANKCSVKRVAVIFLLQVILMIGYSAQAVAEKLNVAVAANFLATAHALTPLLKQKTGIDANWSAGSSGKLYALIINGAPFDVLLAADNIYPKKLEQQGAALLGSRFCYARGKLVLYGHHNRVNEQSLRGPHVKRIAIANPRLAPYGLAAQETLQALNLWDSNKQKLVFGDNVAQALQFVATGNAQLGFVALSQMKTTNVDEQKYWLIPENLYTPLQQEAVQIKASVHPATAAKFMAFLKSKEARATIERYGYSVHDCTN